MLPQPIKEKFPSGPGEIRVSPGAEDFDPDSMLDEPEFSSPEAKIATQNKSIVIGLFLEVPLAEEPMQVAGILHKLTSSRSFLSIQMECLVPFALKVVELAVAINQTGFLCLRFLSSPEEDSLENWQLHGFKLDTASIDEIAGTKALVRLTFSMKEAE